MYSQIHTLQLERQKYLQQVWEGEKNSEERGDVELVACINDKWMPTNVEGEEAHVKSPDSLHI